MKQTNYSETVTPNTCGASSTKGSSNSFERDRTPNSIRRMELTLHMIQEICEKQHGGGYMWNGIAQAHCECMCSECLLKRSILTLL
jgi:hypothetical protein